jgi:hypothetical protein
VGESKKALKKVRYDYDDTETHIFWAAVVEEKGSQAFGLVF